MPLCRAFLGNLGDKIVPQSSAKINTSLINRAIKRFKLEAVALKTTLEFVLSYLSSLFTSYRKKHLIQERRKKEYLKLLLLYTARQIIQESNKIAKNHFGSRIKRNCSSIFSIPREKSRA